MARSVLCSRCTRIFALLELQREVNQRCLAPVHPSQIEAGTDQTNLVPNQLRYQRGFGIIENNTFFIVQPAWTFVDGGDDCIQSDEQNPVSQYAPLGVKCLSLPAKQIDELCNFCAELGARSNNCSALSWPIGNVPGGAGREQLVQLRV